MSKRKADFATSSRSLNPLLAKHGIRLVVFDKDGTLIHCDRCFGPAIEFAVEVRLRDEMKLIKDADACYKVLGYDKVTKKFGTGSVVVHGTNDNVREELAQEAYRQSSRSVALAAEEMATVMSFEDLKPFINTKTLDVCGCYLEELLEKLCGGAESQTKLAICTSDDRMITKHTVSELGLQRFFDLDASNEFATMVCGSDEGIRENPKPSPTGLLRLCKLNEVSAEQTLFVGDSFTDLVAGARAGCQALVFVESGGHTLKELREYMAKSDFLKDWSVAEASADYDAATKVIHVMKDIDGLLVERSS
mmetsp:Transcript_83149/g.178260  ORF Transcript_83149/g.178260 Transcript_83149/m.178260 type:complete len:306 (-) Transcript_83149:104-1021(-)